MTVQQYFLQSGNANQTPAERMGYAVMRACVPLTIASVSCLCGYILGAHSACLLGEAVVSISLAGLWSNLPAVQSLCIFFGVGLIYVTLYNALFFAACVGIDAKRQAAFRCRLLA